MQGKSGGRIIGHAEQIKGHHVMNARRRKMTKECSWIPQVMIVLNRNDPPLCRMKCLMTNIVMIKRGDKIGFRNREKLVSTQIRSHDSKRKRDQDLPEKEIL